MCAWESLLSLLCMLLLLKEWKKKKEGEKKDKVKYAVYQNSAKNDEHKNRTKNKTKITLEIIPVSLCTVPLL